MSRTSRSFHFKKKKKQAKQHTQQPTCENCEGIVVGDNRRLLWEGEEGGGRVFLFNGSLFVNMIFTLLMEVRPTRSCRGIMLMHSSSEGRSLISPMT